MLIQELLSMSVSISRDHYFYERVEVQLKMKLSSGRTLHIPLLSWNR